MGWTMAQSGSPGCACRVRICWIDLAAWTALGSTGHRSRPRAVLPPPWANSLAAVLAFTCSSLGVLKVR